MCKRVLVRLTERERVIDLREGKRSSSNFQEEKCFFSVQLSSLLIPKSAIHGLYFYFLFSPISCVD